MSLRWQDIGERSHALYGDRQPVAHEVFRALCGRWCQVWPSDVQARHDWKYWGGLGWLDHGTRLPCTDCDHIWSDLRALRKTS